MIKGIDLIEGAINTCFGNFDNASQLNMALNMAAYEIYEMVNIYLFYLKDFQKVFFTCDVQLI